MLGTTLLARHQPPRSKDSLVQHSSDRTALRDVAGSRSAAEPRRNDRIDLSGIGDLRTELLLLAACVRWPEA